MEVVYNTQAYSNIFIKAKIFHANQTRQSGKNIKVQRYIMNQHEEFIKICVYKYSDASNMQYKIFYLTYT